MPDEEILYDLAELFKIFGDSTRIKILYVLFESEMCVYDIALLVISIPLSFFGGIGGASRCGILIKGGNYLEALANTSIAVFDKTGTLTKGVFAVSQVSPANGCTEKELLEQAALAESFSSHPISKSLREACSELDARRATDAQEIAGHGVRTMVDGHVVLAGNARMMDDSKITYTKNTGTGTVVYVARDGQFLGSVLIADEVKEHSKQAIAALKAQGVRTIMLTGDSEAVASEISGQLGLDEYHAQLLPADKVNRVEELLATKGKNDILTFAGDGINDAAYGRGGHGARGRKIPAGFAPGLGIIEGAIGAFVQIEIGFAVLRIQGAAGGQGTKNIFAHHIPADGRRIPGWSGRGIASPLSRPPG